MKGSMFFVLLEINCSVSRQNCFLEVNNKDKSQNVCSLGAHFCFVKPSLSACLAVTDFICWESKIILNIKTAFVVNPEVSIC